MSLNWNDYRFFLAVARSGKLSVAGRQLGVDHATVGRRIKALEDACGSNLFDRSPTGYKLTRAGTELMPFAEQVEKGAVLAEDNFNNEDKSFSGTVRIGVPDGVASHIVVHEAQELCQLHPSLEIELVALPKRFSLAKREADFVISVSQPQKGRVKSQKISDYSLHLYGDRDYLAARPPIKKITDLMKVRGIGYISDLIFDPELDYIPQIHTAFKPHLTSTSVHVQAQAIVNGAGVGIMHDFMAAEHDNLVRILPDEISLTRSFWYLVHEDYAALERIRRVSSAIIGGMRQRLKNFR